MIENRKIRRGEYEQEIFIINIIIKTSLFWRILIFLLIRIKCMQEFVWAFGSDTEDQIERQITNQIKQLKQRLLIHIIVV